jgi:hypothetical protein
MKHDRVELLFLHSPYPEACGALPGVIREKITASVAYRMVTRPIGSFFKVTVLDYTSSRTHIRLSQMAVCNTAAQA